MLTKGARSARRKSKDYLSWYLQDWWHPYFFVKSDTWGYTAALRPSSLRPSFKASSPIRPGNVHTMNSCSCSWKNDEKYGHSTGKPLFSSSFLESKRISWNALVGNHKICFSLLRLLFWYFFSRFESIAKGSTEFGNNFGLRRRENSKSKYALTQWFHIRISSAKIQIDYPVHFGLKIQMRSC